MPFAIKQHRIFPPCGLRGFFLCLIVCLCTLSSCIEEFEADLPSDDSGLLVVEGTISSGMNAFVLTRTLPINSNEALPRVSGATLSVRGSDGSEYVAEGYYGQYFCLINSLYADKEYWLHIEVDGEVYESEPQHPLPTEGIAELTGVQSTPESDIDILITPEEPADTTKTGYYLWTYIETWEVRPLHTTRYYFDVERKSCIYKPHQFPERGWKDAADETIIVGSSTNYKNHHLQKYKVYGIKRNNERIFYKYTTLLRQRAISKAEYEYLLACRQADSEMGGLFTPQPSALPTNIRCLTSNKRVIGFVGCSMNTCERRIFLKGTDYSVEYPNIDARQWFKNCDEEFCCEVAATGLYLCEWQDNRPAGPDGLTTAWAFRKFLDVTCDGAYTDMPPYWEE